MLNGFSLFGHALPMTPVGCPNTEHLNSMMYWDVFNRISNVALSRFKWSGLPESCRPEVLEETLFFYGCALFAYDEDLGFIHTPVELVGPWNIYYESVNREAHSFNYNKRFTIADSVVIRANPSMFPDYLTVWNYTPKIANGMRAIDVHTETLKRPFLVQCEEKEKRSVKAALDAVADNEVAIVGSKFGVTSSLNVLDLAKGSYLTDMWANVKNYLNQVYSSLGVKNAYAEKRERMISPEAEGEQNAIRFTLESELKERKLACQRINDMFGLNVDVESNELETFTDEMIELQAARVTGLQGTDRDKEEGDGD